ncbi:chromatin remodelling complex subunit [Colletotrichum truncatum]|uniref:Chromatin remodelling complex subunit n=1 Tax=Colletotrichum truncatum TaxID=5467 RepID=A0ACC3YSD3_COLTU
MNRITHGNCTQLALPNLDDLGQHLKKQHSPLHYCSNCTKFFETERELNAHFDAVDICGWSGARSNSAGTSYERHCQLAAEIGDTGKVFSDADRWYRIWDALFPGFQPPLSPYFDIIDKAVVAGPSASATPKPDDPHKKTTLKPLLTIGDGLQLGGNEYLPMEIDRFGENKVLPNGQLLGGREYSCRTFLVHSRGDTLFMLGTECARKLGYRDSYLLFDKNKSLYRIYANQPEKDDLVSQEIIPFSYRSRQIAIVTARSMFRQFGSRIIAGGRRVRDDYWETKARKQGFTEADLAGEKRPGAAKAREAATEAQRHVILKSPHGEVVYSKNASQFPQPQIVQPGVLGAPTGTKIRMPVITLASELSDNRPRDNSEVFKGGPRSDQTRRIKLRKVGESLSTDISPGTANQTEVTQPKLR